MRGSHFLRYYRIFLPYFCQNRYIQTSFRDSLMDISKEKVDIKSIFSHEIYSICTYPKSCI